MGGTDPSGLQSMSPGASVEVGFTAAGQLYAGTGSGTGELLAKGAAGTVLTVGGADASGLEWIYPSPHHRIGGVSKQLHSHRGLCAVPNDPSLGVGTWEVKLAERLMLLSLHRSSKSRWCWAQLPPRW